MTLQELTQIEEALEITLPSVYKRLMQDFPIPAYAGNTEISLWDDAKALIALNKRLRKKEFAREPWPRRFYAMGEDDGGCSEAIDLEDPEYGVFWFDRQHIGIEKDQRSPKILESWLVEEVRDYTQDLVLNGHDPMATPEQRDQEVEESSNYGCYIMIFIIIIGWIVASVGIAVLTYFLGWGLEQIFE